MSRPGFRRRVMVIDDEAWSRELLLNDLRDDFDVTSFGSGAAALAEFANDPADIVVTDLLMPGMDGMEVVQALRSQGYAGPIVMLTARGESEAVVAALEAGADDYVHKPVDGAVLRARIIAHLRARTPAPVIERFAVGEVIAAKYLLESVIGTGAFGTVFRAEHLHLDMPVALKVLRTETRGDESLQQEFIAEGALSTRVRHPNIVRVLDADVTPGGRRYYVSDLAGGRDLRAVLADGPLAESAYHRLVNALSAALSAIHRAGLLHRDIKPGNIFVDPRPEGLHFQIGDFGMALADGDRLKRQETAGYGTAPYMAPERVTDADYGAPSDVFSAGVVIYESIAGSRPFGTERPVRRGPLPLDPIPQPAMRLLAQMLAVDPAARPAPESVAPRWNQAFGIDA